ncbi:MAG: zinc ABC transporter substrate-binding protein [Fibrobacter sp.]|nr:zinc ABC transporter substrate-binding protein [Fibrobacter sp.]
MKKIAFIASIFALLTLFIACNSDSEKKNSEQAASNGKKISVVATIYPQYAWLKEILGNQADSLDLTLLIKNGMDLHSYKPSAADIATIAKADMIVYVGGESDEWIEKALEATPNEKRVQVNLLAALGDRVKAEEIVEGMQAEEEHEHHEHAEEVENDEHVWLSLKNAEILVMALADAISKVDTAHAMEYHMNAGLYIAKISALDAQYRAAMDSATHKTVLFGDRFPFRYLVDDYGIKYYAAFVGCSAESEASFETVAFLANKMDSLKLPAIFTIDGGNGKIAQAVLAASKKSKTAEVLTLNSMQSIKTSQMDSTSYLDIMRENLEVIKKALK